MSHHQVRNAIQTIVSEIRNEETKLRERYRFLYYQDLIGLVILVCALFGMTGVGWLYYAGEISAPICVIAAAFFASLSHELEHDLIHKQYFRSNALLHNLMMLVVWLMRPNTVNPWYRRKIHLHHHKTSGTKEDLEERLVGNGIRNPLLRLIVIADGLLGLIIFRKALARDISDFRFFTVFNAGFPLTTGYFIVLYSALLYHGFSLLSGGGYSYPLWLLEYMSWVNLLMVILIFPNVIRSVSLNLITSSMHYYGGVNNLLEQTHVINHKLALPLQLFCFNFGATHTIHHFVPNQPFYVRQWLSPKILPILKQHGIRFNDFESVKNANHYA
ncbi:fatty acid desaturase [Pseudoalteromonas sp. MMG022]|uniref:fatty acid desaturase n=1 Tax=Pseudoalteromonas sp. MMG022 TaxID=2909978 RepID=UPI001F01FD7B|nr:fatty acid desaturase [Pseudoalteromonas sp. MMG022]MCF6434369.1 fatty acid desaturase [Pseudoalteromonas sp. MMG022]